MAITIRTGENGSYKSAYTAWFVILDALKAGRVVLTNIEGCEPLDVISKRLDIEFPSTSKLVRISSRDEDGVHLWRYWFCWAPIGALIVIDECQDIYSKKVGFKLENYHYRPLSDFLPLLPDWYEELFNSRNIPVDMSKLEPSDIDDRGKAQYHEDGTHIYPLTFNEGFMRHRKYNWDVNLLSPSWKQIDDGIKECATECFFHKPNDSMFWSKRKPYIFKHPKNASTLVLPKGKNPNLTKKKIPIDAHLMYKSTNTGKFNNTFGTNMLFSNIYFLGSLVLLILCVIGGFYAASMAHFGVPEIQESETSSSNNTVSDDNTTMPKDGCEISDVLSHGGDCSPDSVNVPVQRNALNGPVSLLPFEGVKSVYLTAHNVVLKYRGNSLVGVETRISLNVNTLTGTYTVNERLLNYLEIQYTVIDDCLAELEHLGNKTLIGCQPHLMPVEKEEKPEIKLL